MLFEGELQVPTIPGDIGWIACGNSRMKDSDASFHRFPHTNVHQLKTNVLYSNEKNIYHFNTWRLVVASSTS